MLYKKCSVVIKSQIYDLIVSNTISSQGSGLKASITYKNRAGN